MSPMRRWLRLLILSIAALAVPVGVSSRDFSATASATADRAKPKYTIRDLGTLGGTNSEAFAINNKGQIVGAADIDTYSETWSRIYHAFLYEHGKMTDLGVLGRDKWSRATDINDAGVIVGESIHRAGCLVNETSFLLRDGRMTALKLDERFYLSIAAINNHGHFAGLGNFGKGDIRAFLFDTRLHNLGGFAETNRSEAFGINNSGDVVGLSWINNNEARAFLWRKGEMTNLGTLPEHYASEARDINNKGVIVGWSSPRPTPDYHPRAFIYSNGRIQDLNDVIARDSGWELLEAKGINDAGQIVGKGIFDGKRRAFLLTPE